MKYSIIILITLTSLVFSEITPEITQNQNEYSNILENVRLNNGIRFEFAIGQNYESLLLNHNKIPKKVQDWIKNAKSKVNIGRDIDLMYDPTIGGRVKAEIYNLVTLRNKVSFNYALVETSLPPLKSLKKVCQIVLNMEKCRNELVSPVINNDRLRSEIITKMHYLLNRDYKQILNPLPTCCKYLTRERVGRAS